VSFLPPAALRVRRLPAKLVLAGLLVAAVCVLSSGDRQVVLARKPERPNLILILTDDQTPGDVGYMPGVRALLRDRGTTFRNAFVTDSVCCPSRATILRGQYAHNHEIAGAKPPAGGFEKFRRLGLERSTVATWLKARGYATGFVGKYLNGYLRTTHVPPGWDRWYGFNGGGYHDFTLNENGRNVSYRGTSSYQTDVLGRKALGFVRWAARRDRPFFLHLSPWAPHGPAEPAPRHARLFARTPLPRPPSFDERDVSDKPRWVRDNPRLGREEVREMGRLYRNRLRTLRAVDELVGRLVAALRESGQLENTYIFFTSDNGFHMGHHRLPEGKWTAYEEDIRVPLLVRGPGVPEGRVLPHLVLNNDLAPTFGRLGGARVPGYVDGRSLVLLLRRDPPSRRSWRSAFLVEAASHGESGRPGLVAVRTRGHLYVEYESGERELYDLRRDPHQLRNLYRRAPRGLVRDLKGRLEALAGCSGEGCRAAEDGPGRDGGR